jgi:ABC-type lipoprotein export system ATPase subunit
MTIIAGIARVHGRAVLVVTHDTRLLEFADRILYIEDGALTHEEQRQRANVYRLRAEARPNMQLLWACFRRPARR